jgi:hypothetical protein
MTITFAFTPGAILGACILLVSVAAWVGLRTVLEP